MARNSFGTVEQLKSGKYRAYFRVPGHIERIRAPFTFTRKTDARAWLAQQQADIERGVWKHPDQIKAELREAKEKAITFGQWLEEYWQLKAFAHTTRRAMQSNIETHVTPYWGDKPLIEITARDVETWISRELNKLSPGARRKSFDNFRAVIRSAHDSGIITTLPLRRNMLGSSKGLDKKTRNKDGVALTPEELSKLIQAMPQHLQTRTLLAGLLALRIGELRGLHVEDYNPVQHTLTIRRSVSNDGKNRQISTPKTKAGTRTITLPTHLAKAVSDQIKGREHLPNAPIFESPDRPGDYFSARAYATTLKRASIRAGVPVVSPHDLRRTGATNAGRARGVGVGDVQALLGHETPAMTMKYIKGDGEVISNALAGIAQEVLNPQPQHSNLIQMKKAQ